MDEAFIGTIVAWPMNFAPRGWAFCDGKLMSVSQNTSLFSLIGNYYGGDGRTTFALPDLRGRTIVGAGRGVRLSNYSIGQMSGQEKISLDLIMPAHTHELPKSGMSVDLSSAELSITATETDVNLEASYGLPITSSGSDATSMPNDSEHYLGSPKMPNGSGLNTYYTSNTEPTITTKATTIEASGKITPKINSTMSGSAAVNVADGLSVSDAGRSGYLPLTQPSLSMNYIICLLGIYPSRY